MEKSVQISSHLLICVWNFFRLYKIVYGLSTFADAWFSLSIYRRFQIFKIIKFASWIFVFLVLTISSVKINILGSFFAKMRAFTRFRFVVLVAKFELAGFRKQKIQSLWPFPCKWSVWQNPDQERTNQNAGIYLKTILPYNKIRYWTSRNNFVPSRSFPWCSPGNFSQGDQYLKLNC